MVRIRLWRGGKKKFPIYRIVAIHGTKKRNGEYLEAIGRYNPGIHPPLLELNDARIFSWLKKGALPSDTVRSLFQSKGLWLKWGLMKKGADEATIAVKFEAWQALQPDKAKRRAEKKERRKAVRRKKSKADEAPAAAAPAAVAAPAAAAETQSAAATAAETQAAEEAVEPTAASPTAPEGA